MKPCKFMVMYEFVEVNILAIEIEIEILMQNTELTIE